MGRASQAAGRRRGAIHRRPCRLARLSRRSYRRSSRRVTCLPQFGRRCREWSDISRISADCARFSAPRWCFGCIILWVQECRSGTRSPSCDSGRSAKGFRRSPSARLAPCRVVGMPLNDCLFSARVCLPSSSWLDRARSCPEPESVRSGMPGRRSCRRVALPCPAATRGAKRLATASRVVAPRYKVVTACNRWCYT